MTPECFELLGLLKEARIVGGAVRDHVLQRPIQDIDITTTLTPQEVMQTGLHCIPTGIDHGTVTVIYKGVSYEVTTLREDITTDGRHATVRFGTDFRKDAARRDFTINAMSMSQDAIIHDYFNGMEDAKNGMVRFIGEAETRIKEDYLRILRFFRFTYLYGKSVDSHGLQACFALQAGLDTLSKERIRDELMKILSAANELTLMGNILPRLIGEVNLSPFKSADPVVRLAQIAVKSRDDAMRLKLSLKLSNEVYRRLDSLAVGRPVTTLNEAKSMLYSCGKRGFADRIALYGSAEFADLPSVWTAPTFPVTGEMLKAKGFHEGATLGAELARLKNLWLEGGCSF